MERRIHTPNLKNLGKALLYGSLAGINGCAPVIPRESIVATSTPSIGEVNPTSIRILHTQIGTQIDVVNRTDVIFNELLGIKVIEFLQGLPERISTFTFEAFDEEKGYRTIEGIIQLRPARQHVFFFDTPEATPIDLDRKRSDSFTLIYRWEDSTIMTGSQVRLYPSLSDLYNTSSTGTFGTEACQAVIQIIPQDEQQSDEELIIQEEFCNSWGRAFFARQLGLGYEEYFEQFAEKILQLPFIEPPVYFRVRVLPKEEYLLIPQEQVFSIRS